MTSNLNTQQTTQSAKVAMTFTTSFLFFLVTPYG